MQVIILEFVFDNIPPWEWTWHTLRLLMCGSISNRYFWSSTGIFPWIGNGACFSLAYCITYAPPFSKWDKVNVCQYCHTYVITHDITCTVITNGQWIELQINWEMQNISTFSIKLGPAVVNKYYVKIDSHND